jgi:16S rRNA (cytosine1402-N4)-methyltransferase
MAHTTVLLKQTIDLLDIKAGDIIVDATTGNAGHIKEAASRAGNLTLICIDADETAIKQAKKNLLTTEATKIFAISYFDQLKEIINKNHIQNIDKTIFDLGLRTDQIENAERGFSFRNDGPLKMTFQNNPDENSVTAYDVVNDWQEENLADIIYGFGEEQFSRRIAKAIVENREVKKIETTTELAEIIYKAVPFWYRHKKIHPATKTFQAIRMAVNRELQQIKTALKDAYELLNPGGRIAVISFHSLEDRIVKRIFNKFVEEKNGRLIIKKPLVPDETETSQNPKSRSAKLRVIEKIK